MIKVIVAGNTYSIRYALKEYGFRWNPNTKAWFKTFNDSDKEDAEALVKKVKAVQYENKSLWTGLTVKTEHVEGKAQEKKYMVKESWIFNLESMHDKAFCLIYDMQEGKITAPFTVAGKTINSEDDLYALIDEADTLRWKASRGVNGKDYGRIKEIVEWRVGARYARCLANGMSEAEAGKCFEDM